MPGAFRKRFMCYSGIVQERENVDRGGKIILPHSCMEQLARMEITYPMMFEVSNPSTGKKSHCGVLEFTAHEGHVICPYWLMKHLNVGEGQEISVSDTTLPRGTFIRIQPQQQEFIALSNPKAVLESRLNNFSCLTKGDTILINYTDRNYPINILECKVGDKEVNAISIVETDVKVDFARPLDMPPSPERKPAPAPAASSSASGGLTFGNSLLDRQRDADGGKAAPAGAAAAAPATDSSGGAAGGVKPFAGAGRTLGGVPVPSNLPPPPVRAPPAATDSYGRPLRAVGDEPKSDFVAFSGRGRSMA
ncbi:Ubiquitin fusion degradation protein 1-like protein [Diplonema papillatum]|nr:Ubiquitin fusion degradation protein 1-like protein [Diplonema papillatum]